MKDSGIHTWIVEIIAALLILLFVYTGITKLIDQASFRGVISRSPLIGRWSTFLSWALPIVELSAALLLFFPKTKKQGLWISLGLMILFTGYIAYMLLFSDHLPCSCGGVLQQLTWLQHLVFNIIFTFLSALSIWFYTKQQRFIAINRNSRTPV